MTSDVQNLPDRPPDQLAERDPLLRAVGAISYHDLRCYLTDQIATARSTDELLASARLVSAVLAKRAR